MSMFLLLVGPMLIVGWQILTWLQACFWPSLPLVTAVEGRLTRTIVAPVIAIAIIASSVTSGFVARAAML
jgi:hypothetical protein